MMITKNIHSSPSTGPIRTPQGAPQNLDQYKTMSDKRAINILSAYSGKLDTAAGIGKADQRISNKDLSAITEDESQPMELRQAAMKALKDSAFKNQINPDGGSRGGLLSFDQLERSKSSMSKQMLGSDGSEALGRSNTPHTSIRPYVSQPKSDTSYSYVPPSKPDASHSAGVKEFDEILNVARELFTQVKKILDIEESSSRPIPTRSASSPFDRVADLFRELFDIEKNSSKPVSESFNLDKVADLFRELFDIEETSPKFIPAREPERSNSSKLDNFIQNLVANNKFENRGYIGRSEAVELDTNKNSTFSQTLNLPNDGKYQFGLDYAIRSGDKATGGLEVHIDGKLTQTIFPNSKEFSRLNLDLNLEKGSHTFEIKGVGKSDSVGPLIDNVKLQRYKDS